MRRTMLFSPGNSPNILINSGSLGADAIIFDLEDAISPDEKDSARILVEHTLEAMEFDCEVIIRINSVNTPYWELDLETVIPKGPDTILVPMVSTVDHIHQVIKKIEALEKEHKIEKKIMLIPLIETVLGVENSYAIAGCSDRISALFLGAEDLTADMRVPRTKEGGEIAYARGRVVVAARAAGVGVMDTPFTDVNDLEGLRKDAELARSLGFSGKALISPRHVDIVNEVFSPSATEIEYAQRVLQAIDDAMKQGKGVISMDGKMIDGPIVDRAKTVIETAKELGMEVD